MPRDQSGQFEPAKAQCQTGRNGVPLLPVSEPETVVTLETVNTLRDELVVTHTPSDRPSNLRYEGRDGLCRFDLRFAGLMDPFDPLDASQNPMLAKFGGDTEASTGAGDSWSKRHYDLVGHITGDLELYGTSYKVDCIDGLDQRWGQGHELSILQCTKSYN